MGRSVGRERELLSSRGLCLQRRLCRLRLDLCNRWRGGGLRSDVHIYPGYDVRRAWAGKFVMSVHQRGVW